MNGAVRTVVGLILVAGTLATAPADAVDVERRDQDLDDVSLPRPAGALISDVLNETLTGLESTQGVAIPDVVVTVEVIASDTQAAAAAVVAAGGVVLGTVDGQLLLAEIPAGSLHRVERAAPVRYLRSPVRVDLVPPTPQPRTGPAPRTVVVGQEVTKTNADAWHAAGFTGVGVKIGIIDYFAQAAWQDAKAAGEVPNVAGNTFCRNQGANCPIWIADSAHGVAVAEIIHEMAPDAELFIATAATTADLQAAVDWMGSRGVDIISRSLGAPYDGPGDGTGPLAAVVDSAVGQGMFFVNAAGNAAGSVARAGSYWRDRWRDDDNDGFMDFALGDELLDFYSCTGMFGVRWDDWGEASKTDFDIAIAETADDAHAGEWEWVSAADQVNGADPVELFPSTCSGDLDVDYLVIARAGGPNPNDTIEFMTNGLPVEYPTNPYSAAISVVDSASEGMVAVGAIDPPEGTAIAPYSSRGPSNDFRKKPDLAAASCVDSFTYVPCFDGTSAAAPVVAGAAALILDAGLASSPAQLRDYLVDQATVDRGAPGANNAYGHGEVVLPVPPGAEADNAIHIADVRVIMPLDRDYVLGRVTIEDEDGNRVEGVTVTARWSGEPLKADVTKDSGMAVFKAFPQPAEVMEICVADIAKQGYVYDRDADVAECAAATWYPGGGGDPLHVEDIRVILDASRDRALGRFWVEDHMGNPVEGVLVTAEWTVNGVGQGAETKGTNSAGIAVFHLVSPPPGAELDICVESLAKNGYGYNEHANVVDCESDAWWVGIGDALYVADVRLVLKQPQDRALGWIYVEDQTGTRIKGVTVTAEWRVDGNGEGEVAKRTNSNGRATFRYDSPSPGAMLEICVHDLTKTGYVYFAAANVADCDTATWPGGADEPG